MAKGRSPRLQGRTGECDFCGEAPALDLVAAKGGIAICASCRVQARERMDAAPLGTVACSFCTRLRPPRSMTALLVSTHRPDVAICNECLALAESATATDRVTRGCRDGETGIGSLLMQELDAHGNPLQALFYFDAADHPTRLVTDADGRPLGFRTQPDGSVSPPPDSYVPLPDGVASAARQSLTELGARS